MELPHIGEHCSEIACRQLDFLPFTCSLCKKVYCLQHHKIADHNCPNAASIDAQVPVCPLCNQAVPAPRGTLPDIAISEHLDNNCVVKKEEIFKNKCSYKTCRKKEMMPVTCPECGLNYCIPHRHPEDHNCSRTRAPQAKKSSSRPSSTNGSLLQSLRDAAAAQRTRFTGSGSSQPSLPTQPVVHSHPASMVHAQAIQGDLTEDEALALALSQSQMDEVNGPSSGSSSGAEQQQRRQRRPPSNFSGSKDNCIVS